MRAHSALEYNKNGQIHVVLFAVVLGLVVGLYLVFAGLS